MKMFLKRVRHYFRMKSIMNKELKHNVKYTGFDSETDIKIRWRLLLLAHSLEKGLSICDSRPDFGKGKAEDLLRLLQTVKDGNSTGKDLFEYKLAVSILKRYRTHRETNGLDTGFLSELDQFGIDGTVLDAGIRNVEKDVLYCDPDAFADLCNKRHSIREYSDIRLSKDDIVKAIDTARFAPSACNRQMAKVFFTLDPSKNRQFAEYIPGNYGTKDDNATYLFICADKTAFDYFEAYQWYLNGGIFASYLSLALTSNNVGNCIYQWPVDFEYTDTVKAQLGIPESYEIVTVISAGYYKETVRFPNSVRKPVEDYYQETIK